MTVCTQHIVDFLQKQEWSLEEGTSDNLFHFIPPKVFNFPEWYRIRIPSDTSSPDFERYIKEIVNILSLTYDISSEELSFIFSPRNQAIEIRKLQPVS